MLGLIIWRVNEKLLKQIRVTTLSKKGHLIGKPIFVNKIQKTGRGFQKSPEINTRGTNTNVRNTFTRNQGARGKSKYKGT